MPNVIEDAIKSARLDKVNISVYGNPVLDVIVDVREGAGRIAERAAIEEVASIRRSGNLEFDPDTYIGFYLQGEPIVWGPFNPDGQTQVYAVGGKYQIPIHTGDEAEKIVDMGRASILAGPLTHIGGGAANVLFGFYDIFAQLRVELLATIEKATDHSRGRLDRFIKPLIDRIGPYTQIPLYDLPGINLAIEGLGLNLDRTIFTAKLPREEAQLKELPMPLGRAVMVNTIYSPQVALDALAHACTADRLGFLALTKSLCMKKPLPEGIFDKVFDRHPSHRSKISEPYESIHEFIVKYALPQSDCICILNESELEHLTDVKVGVDRGESYLPALGGVIEALKKMRVFQGGRRQRIYTTVGSNGSIVLDENDTLIYCGVIEDKARIPLTKTAIGDTYATFVLALETIGNYIREHNIPARAVVKAAAAGADSGVYDGFGNLAVNKVNNFLGDGNRRLVSLGPLASFPTRDWMDRSISEVRSSDWERLVREDYINDYKGFVPNTLQEVIGGAFLKLPGDDWLNAA